MKKTWYSSVLLFTTKPITIRLQDNQPVGLTNIQIKYPIATPFTSQNYCLVVVIIVETATASPIIDVYLFDGNSIVDSDVVVHWRFVEMFEFFPSFCVKVLAQGN